MKKPLGGGGGGSAGGGPRPPHAAVRPVAGRPRPPRPIQDPRPPQGPSQGLGGRITLPSGRNSNSRNSWPNLPLCPT